jgi:SWI/SNF-related matrix-associated actin-dependent regulator of chromatin subfamily A-like protein 1
MVETKNKSATMAVNQFGDRVIKIQFPYDLDLLYKVRTLSGRKYHPEIKTWSAPVSMESVKLLVEWGFSLDDHLQTFVQKTKVREETISTIGIPGLKGTLRPFQNVGVAMMETKGGRALVADEQGLGKTIEALAWLQLHRDRTPVIIVVPASVKLNWQREAEDWIPNPRVEILYGNDPWKITGDIVILNYDIVPGWLHTLKKLNAQVLILDEAHYIKTDKAKRTKAVKMLAKGIPYFLALSGTPIQNRPIEIYNAVNIADPGIFPSKWNFMNAFCAPKYNGFGWNFNGSSRADELHKILTSTVMIRRLKKDVLPELPDKVYSIVPMQLDNRQEYKFAEDHFIEFVRRSKGAYAAARASGAEALVQIEALKQLAVKGALEESLNWISDFLETDQKLVVFATHKFVIDALMNRFGTKIAVKIDGTTPIADRQRAIDIFQHNTEVRLFVGNMKAAGVGITLTAASNMVFLELPWTGAEIDQATDRLHRITQKFMVNIYFLLAKNTIMDKLAKILDVKRKVIDAIMDGIETDSSSLLSELLKSYE